MFRNREIENLQSLEEVGDESVVAGQIDSRRPTGRMRFADDLRGRWIGDIDHLNASHLVRDVGIRILQCHTVGIPRCADIAHGIREAAVTRCYSAASSSSAFRES
jgi:hypothetical protein